MISELQLFTTLDTLEQRLGRLIGLNSEYRQRLDQLVLENDTLKDTVREQQKQIREFQKSKTSGTQIVDKSIKFSKIVSDNLAQTADSADIKQKLDAYIRDVDRCIAYLSDLS
jgi:regulator of replication initiation timing